MARNTLFATVEEYGVRNGMALPAAKTVPHRRPIAVDRRSNRHEAYPAAAITLLQHRTQVGRQDIRLDERISEIGDTHRTGALPPTHPARDRKVSCRAGWSRCNPQCRSCRCDRYPQRRASLSGAAATDCPVRSRLPARDAHRQVCLPASTHGPLSCPPAASSAAEVPPAQ